MLNLIATSPKYTGLSPGNITLKLVDMTAFTAGRPRISHGMARFAHPVGDVLAKSFNMAGSFSCLSVTISAIGFQIRLV
jgi:hypothetical protein